MSIVHTSLKSKYLEQQKQRHVEVSFCDNQRYATNIAG